MTDLKKEKSYVTLVGNVKINDKSFEGEKTSKSGYKYKQVNIGFETAEGNVIYGQMMGGFVPSKPIIFTFGKDGEKAEIAWADRKQKAIVDTISDYKLYRFGIVRKEDNKLDVQKFLSPYDAHDYLKENLKDGELVVARGTFSYSEYNGETQRRFEIQSIFLPKQPDADENGNIPAIERFAHFVQTYLFDEDSFKRIAKADKEAGEIFIKGYVPEYVGKRDGKEIKKTLAFPTSLCVKLNPDSAETTEKIAKLLFNVKKGKVRVLTVEGTIVDGYETSEISSGDIEVTDDIKELMALGLYNEETLKERMTVRGNRQSKLVFERPYIIKDENNPDRPVMDKDDDKYVPEDLFYAEDEEAPTASDTAKTDGEEDAGVDVTKEQKAKDDKWMKDLGLEE
jgi:hypothetical protein